MVLYPAFLLSIFSPGLFFPEMGDAAASVEAQSNNNNIEKQENSDEGGVMGLQEE
jgi:hypothetical protein